VQQEQELKTNDKLCVKSSNNLTFNGNESFQIRGINKLITWEDACD